jgi:hypothetical protein
VHEILEELPHAFDKVVDPPVTAAVMDEVETLVEADPEGSRAAVLDYASGDGIWD